MSDKEDKILNANEINNLLKLSIQEAQKPSDEERRRIEATGKIIKIILENNIEKNEASNYLETILSIINFTTKTKTKVEKVKKLNIPPEKKNEIILIIDEITQKYEDQKLGFFEIPFTTFKAFKITEDDEMNIINLFKLINNEDIDLKNLKEFLEKHKLKGLGMSTLSQILFILKPDIFPIVNNKVKDAIEKIFELKNSQYFDNIVNYPEIVHKINKLKEDYEIEDNLYLDKILSYFLSNFKKDIIDNIKGVLETYKQIILYGPPGTGKTFLAKEVASELLGEKDSDKKPQFKFVVFHPSFEYEDFIRGIRPVPTEQNEVKFETREGHFMQMVWKAHFLAWKKKKKGNDEKKNFNEKCVIIIDEINRGNLPNLLGELIYAIEDDKRVKSFEIPYPVDEKEIEKAIKELDPSNGEIEDFKNEFLKNHPKPSIPENLYIIGTMNTSDRSIGVIDAAIRRRFPFFYIGPDPEHVGDYKDAFIRLNCLFLGEKWDKIKSEKLDELLKNREIRKGGVGHSYFMKEDKEKRIKYFVIPLLKEYYELGIPEENFELLNEICKKYESGQDFKNAVEQVLSIEKING